MITPYKDNAENIWIPVATGKSGGAARAFLPFNGLHGNYTFGFKAAPTRGKYFEALIQIQQAYIDDESKVFRVNGGKKEEKQWKARWRHGNREGSPLLGPTLGWVKIPVADLEKTSDALLGEALIESGDGRAILATRVIPPVLCESLEELEHESSRLFRELSGRKPVGQNEPRKIRGSIDLFVRDAAVVAYVLREADGQCECCKNPSPFAKRNGLPYLEVHHVLPLASGGSDRTSNAIAVCPNCHRELHHGTKSAELVERLYSRIERLEREHAGAQQGAQLDSLLLAS
jgi:5-methylcytosine-specific restriction protein A